jgi:hypothetical protein
MRGIFAVVILLAVIYVGAVVTSGGKKTSVDEPLPTAWYHDLNPSDTEGRLFDDAVSVGDGRIVNPRRIDADILAELFPGVVFVEFLRLPSEDSGSSTYGGRNWIAVDPRTELTCLGARFGNVEKLFQMRKVSLLSMREADRVCEALDAFLNPMFNGAGWSRGTHELQEDGTWIFNMSTPAPFLIVTVGSDGFISDMTYRTRAIPVER